MDSVCTCGFVRLNSYNIEIDNYQATLSDHELDCAIQIMADKAFGSLIS